MAYVMIVDDDEDFADAAARVLRSAGHEVAISLDTHSALERMAQRPPDMAILDVIFPEDISAGFELARTMRHAEPKLAAVPILMLTAVNQKFPLGFGPEDIDDDYLPVADFVEKPVDLDVLANRVSALLGGAGSAARGEDA